MSNVIADNLLAKSSTVNPPSIKGSGGAEVGKFCRAFVSFNGTGTVAILGSMNVSSITDNGTGDYTVNFTNALPDVNYTMSLVGPTGNGRWLWPYTGTYNTFDSSSIKLTTSLRISYRDNAGTSPADATPLDVAIFR